VKTADKRAIGIGGKQLVILSSAIGESKSRGGIHTSRPVIFSYVVALTASHNKHRYTTKFKN
jgi:hypothetical protein